MIGSDEKESGVTEHRANSDHGENFVENHRKKQLTGKVPYNIITQCDVVRDTLANSPGDGIYQRFRTFPQ